MTGYYRRSVEYVRRGPPATFLRIVIAPLTVSSTVALIATGIAAAALGRGGVWLGLHKVSFFIWLGAMSIRVLTRVLKLPGLIAADWWRRDALAGRRARQLLVGSTLVSGVVLAFVTLPFVDHWQDRSGGIAH